MIGSGVIPFNGNGNYTTTSLISWDEPSWTLNTLKEISMGKKTAIFHVFMYFCFVESGINVLMKKFPTFWSYQRENAWYILLDNPDVIRFESSKL